ncbi:MAG: hypothetical protein Q7V15_07510 [Phenylobacterium sp.]|uniref:hypothetical protein n=1 Tax=Phenylobacterium sp. TaxID=1871053 RepID=UPI00271F2131|nr:hypothetical protein [Phenylobacterium sp.]MDO8901183.1 hypothetical protein [Phenylobacterium sp.]
MSLPMNRFIDRLKLVFFGAFLLSLVGIFGYHAHVVWPAERCESKGSWWDPDGRVCARPVLISDITGRTIPERKAAQQAEAEARAAAAAP